MGPSSPLPLEGPAMLPRSALRNVLLLAFCQALALSCQSLSMAASSLVGQRLADDVALTTLPLGLQYFGTMAATMPASLLMKKIGRRPGLSIGTLFGMASGALTTTGVLIEHFWVFSAGTFCLGVFAGHVFFYRFAAADAVAPEQRSRVISYVLAGGLAAAFIGPEIAKRARELIGDAEFAGAYAFIIALAFLSLILLQFIRIPRPSEAETRSGGRPLATLLRNPSLPVAILAGMVGYGAMNMIMVATPLATIAYGHGFDSAALVIQWHIVGMYLPAFFTGTLIHRLGVFPILVLGALIILACVAVNLMGTSIYHIFSALVLLGFGWNFLYVGGSTLLTTTYRPEEKAKIQGLNDFSIAGTMTLSAFTTGAVFQSLGWQAVNLLVVGPLLFVVVLAIWLSLRQARRPQEGLPPGL